MTYYNKGSSAFFEISKETKDNLKDLLNSLVELIEFGVGILYIIDNGKLNAYIESDGNEFYFGDSFNNSHLESLLMYEGVSYQVFDSGFSSLYTVIKWEDGSVFGLFRLVSSRLISNVYKYKNYMRIIKKLIEDQLKKEYIIFRLQDSLDNLELKDKAELKKVKAELEFYKYSSITDFRTNVYNNGYFHQTLDKMIARKEKFIVGLFEVDSFHKINKAYTEITGDKVLVDLANILKEKFYNYGSIYRYNADTFALITDKLDCLEIQAVYIHIADVINKSSSYTVTDYTINCACLHFKHKDKSNFIIELIEKLKANKAARKEL